jgi:DMSO/TMAO reductase YedYZ molybdopterin-dependent catalytic subunit
MTLPPGQHRIKEFPRFGTHLNRPPPAVPANPTIEVSGAVVQPFAVPLADLATLPRRELIADFHCVAGWSATGLRWEGVPFETFHRELLEPSLSTEGPITHVRFSGLDGFQSVLLLEDALAGDVLVADRLDGRPLDADHGAPVRLVSPGQYGYVSTKHLCRVELHASAPTQTLGSAHPLGRILLRGPLIERHPRARVWQEERHPYTPAWLLRPVYRLLIPPLRLLCARGYERRQPPPAAD